jgi:hypothetical protein
MGLRHVRRSRLANIVTKLLPVALFERLREALFNHALITLTDRECFQRSRLAQSAIGVQLTRPLRFYLELTFNKGKLTQILEPFCCCLVPFQRSKSGNDF